jgi:hypothetical protein
MRKAKEVKGIIATMPFNMKKGKITVRIIKDDVGASMAVWGDAGVEYIVDLDELKDMLEVVE